MNSAIRLDISMYIQFTSRCSELVVIIYLRSSRKDLLIFMKRSETMSKVVGLSRNSVNAIREVILNFINLESSICDTEQGIIQAMLLFLIMLSVTLSNSFSSSCSSKTSSVLPDSFFVYQLPMP